MRSIRSRAGGFWCGRVLPLATLVWCALLAGATAGPMEAYVAATNTTHHHWNELALEPVASITGPGDGHIWKTDANGEDRVLVTTLVNSFVAGIYRPYVNETYTLGATRQIWVTLAGEMTEYLNARPTEWTNTPESIAERAQIALGTPISSNYTHTVSMWVRPDDLFRPAIQWDVTQSTMLRPNSGEHDQWEPDLAAYKAGPAWFGTQYADRFSSTTGNSTTLYDWYQDWWTKSDNAATGPGAFPFPWTGLGYTYDYYYQVDTMTAGDYQKVVGLSEFIIAPKYSVIVHSVSTLDRIVLPEPATWVLMISFAGTLALRHRSRR